MARVTLELVTHIVVDTGINTDCHADVEAELKGIYSNLAWGGNVISAGQTIGNRGAFTVVSAYTPDVPTFISVV